MAHSIAIIGIGKITQDQHLPVIAKNPRFKLAAVVSQRGLTHQNVPSFRTPAELYAALPEVERSALGSRVVCDDKILLFEEHPDAYKAIEPVIAALEAHRQATRVADLSPLITVKL